MIITDAWYPQLNGVVRTYEYLKTELEAKGHDVLVIGPRDFRYRLPLLGYREIDLALLTTRTIKKKISDFTPDVIHIATEGPLGCAARKLCKRLNLPFTTCYHTQFPDYIAKRVKKFLPFLENWTHDKAIEFIVRFHNASSGVFVTTNSMAIQLKKWGITAPIKPLTRGVDTTIFYPDSVNVLDDLPRPIALYVGRLAVEKNIQAFLDMDWVGSKVVIGHGPEEKTLKRKYKNVHFLGKKSGKELGDYYRATDVFVFPSLTDTFGMVIIEALACGAPVAAYNTVGPKDIITNNHLGCLNENLSKAANDCLNCGDKKERYSHVIENYSWALAAQQFLDAHQTQSLKKAA